MIDYGTFIDLADKLSEKCKKVYYHSPIDDEYLDIKDCCIGDGLMRKGHRIERVDEFITSEMIKEVDLFVFPDIGWGGAQRYLRDDCKKAVWGHMGLDSHEIYRTKFIKILENLGMDVIPWKKIIGLTNLRLHLQKVERKWIKVNRYRQNMETWFHKNYIDEETTEEIQEEDDNIDADNNAVELIISRPFNDSVIEHSRSGRKRSLKVQQGTTNLEECQYGCGRSDQYDNTKKCWVCHRRLLAELLAQAMEMLVLQE